jgi:hypothetical protein
MDKGLLIGSKCRWPLIKSRKFASRQTPLLLDGFFFDARRFWFFRFSPFAATSHEIVPLATNT